MVIGTRAGMGLAVLPVGDPSIILAASVVSLYMVRITASFFGQPIVAPIPPKVGLTPQPLLNI